MPKRLRIFPLSGNKERSLNILLPEVQRAIELGTNSYSELFLGSGSLFLNLPHENFLSYSCVEINEGIISIWKLIQENTWEQFHQMMNDCLNGKDIRIKNDYSLLRQEYNDDNDPMKLWLLFGSCLSSKPRWNDNGHFNQSCGRRDFSKRITSQWFNDIKKIINNTEIIAGTWAQNINQFQDDNRLIFLDPPYLAKVQSSMGSWTENDLLMLLSACNNAKAKVILTDIELPEHTSLLSGWKKSVIRNMVSSGPHRFEQDTGLDECMWTNF